MRGDTDAKILDKDGVKFWNANGTREFLDNRGLDYPEGQLGPVYGHQWRNFNKPYNTKSDDKYADQLKNVIQLLKKDPTTRRAIISAWNPNQLDQMALPPCHVLYQFWISNNKKLHCSVFQRSGDIGLGIPFNIASASLFTHLIARATGNVAVELVHFISDAHVYSNHVEALQKQVLRVPSKFPTIEISDDAPKEDIWNIKFKHIKLKNYKYAPPIHMKMAV